MDIARRGTWQRPCYCTARRCATKFDRPCRDLLTASSSAPWYVTPSLHGKMPWNEIQNLYAYQISMIFSIDGRVITTSGFGKRTIAMLEFYFWFRFWPNHSHRHGKLHRYTKFYPNLSTHGGVMTSYRFFKMAAMASQVYFRLQVWWRNSFEKVKIYLHTKFRWDISIHSRVIITSGFEKTATILEYYFRFAILIIYIILACCPI